MNCDQAFDAMTDPDRPHDRELGDHLRACPRCRQMYETLEPALGLFAAADDDAGEVSPASPARLASSHARLARQIAGRMSSAGSRSPKEPPRRRLWGAVFAAAVAGFLLSVGLSSLSPQFQPASPGAASACTWLNRDAVPDRDPASAVVVACVRCHLSRSHDGDRQQTQTSFREFSRELESLVKAWHDAQRPSSSASAIAMLVPVSSRSSNSGHDSAA